MTRLDEVDSDATDALYGGDPNKANNDARDGDATDEASQSSNQIE